MAKLPLSPAGETHTDIGHVPYCKKAHEALRGVAGLERPSAQFKGPVTSQKPRAPSLFGGRSPACVAFTRTDTHDRCGTVLSRTAPRMEKGDVWSMAKACDNVTAKVLGRSAGCDAHCPAEPEGCSKLWDVVASNLTPLKNSGVDERPRGAQMPNAKRDRCHAASFRQPPEIPPLSAQIAKVFHAGNTAGYTPVEGEDLPEGRWRAFGQAGQQPLTIGQRARTRSANWWQGLFGYGPGQA